jgi:hypothetical protein
MFRWLIRSIGLAFLALSLGAVVADAAHSIAMSAWSMTAVGPLWFSFAPLSLTRLQEFVTVRVEPTVGPWVWNPLLTSLLRLPASVLAAAIGFALLIAAELRRPRRAYARSR